jgi:hypothetical protein
MLRDPYTNTSIFVLQMCVCVRACKYERGCEGVQGRGRGRGEAKRGQV